MKANKYIRQTLHIATFSRRRVVITAFLIHSAIMLLIIIGLIFLGKDYSYYLLIDDGYYNLSESFVKGNFFENNVLGFGLPLIYMPIHLFPEYLHPFIRLIISQGAVFFILNFLSKITENKLSNKQLLFGAILVVINPVFVQWSFKTSVDLYLTLMMAGFLYYLFKYNEKFKTKYFLLSLLFFGYSIFLRPSFILIPAGLIFISLVVLRSKSKVKVSSILFLFTLICFYLNSLYIGYNGTQQKDLNSEMGRDRLFPFSYAITEIIIETRQYHKGTIDDYNIKDKKYSNIEFETGKEYLKFRANKNIKAFNDKYPNGNMLDQMWFFAITKPRVFFARIFLGPIFYFSLSSRELYSYILLIITIIYFFINIKSLRCLAKRKENKEFFIILFTILFSYFLFHWATHSFSRYSLVVLPFIYIWGGIYIEKMLMNNTFYKGMR